MKKGKWLCTISLCIIALVGCGNAGTENDGNSNRKDVYSETDGESESSKVAVPTKLSETTFEEYGLRYNLIGEWANAKVFEGQPDSSSPVYDMAVGIDPAFFNIVVRHPNWSEEEPMQDVVFNVFHVEPWNQNNSSDVMTKMSENLGFNEDYVMVLDRNYYDINAKGYDQAIELLYANSNTEWDEGDDGVYDMFVVSIEADQVQYSLDTSELKIKWDNIMPDVIRTNSVYFIEMEKDGSWEEVIRFDENDGEYSFEVPETRGFVTYYRIGDSINEKGKYRLGVEYTRDTLYGLELKEGMSHEYVTYCEFNVLGEDIKRENSFGTLEGVTFELENDTYKVGTQYVKVIWTNELEDGMTFGEAFSLEKYVDGEWVKVIGEGEYSFNSIGYILEPNSEREQELWIGMYDADIDEGRYRIRTDFIRDSFDGVDFGSGNYPSYEAFGEFEIVR